MLRRERPQSSLSFWKKVHLGSVKSKLWVQWANVTQMKKNYVPKPATIPLAMASRLINAG